MAMVYNDNTGNYDWVEDEQPDPYSPSPSPQVPPNWLELAQNEAIPPGSPAPTGGGGKTPAEIEAEGREYDRQHGYIGGYMMDGVWVNGSPTTSTGPSGERPVGGGGPNYTILPFSPYQAYGPFVPRNATFNFDPYKASSWADAENEPGYKASRDQLKKQVEAGAAYKGMVRSGMTIGDLYTNLDALGQQNFTNFDNRNFRNWTGNRDLAATKFGLELGVDRDIYDRGATENDRANNYRFNTEDSSFKDALARWQTMTQSLTSLARPVA